jgi:hypothetical protein
MAVALQLPVQISIPAWIQEEPLGEEPLAVYSRWGRASHFSLAICSLVGHPCSTEWPYSHEHKTYPSITVVAYVFALLIFTIMYLAIVLQALPGTEPLDTVCTHNFHIVGTKKPSTPELLTSYTFLSLSRYTCIFSTTEKVIFTKIIISKLPDKSLLPW